jgi:glycosyltransferase involved in cell wall biosynthesis
MNSKKILYLRTDLCTVQIIAGGSVGHTLGVICALKKDFDCFVFSSQMHALLEIEKSIQFFPLHVLQVFWLLRWRFWYLRWRLESLFSTFFFFIQVLCKTRKLHFSFIYQRYSILNGTGLLVSWYKNIPLILEYNGSEAYWFDVPQHDLWYRRWFAFRKLSYYIEHLNVTYADTIVVVSQALKDDLLSKGVDGTKILVNPNGVDTTIFNSENLMGKRESIRAQYNFKDTFVFGFIGTFGHWHGIEVLEYIIPLICSSRENARFLLVGDGALKAHAQEVLYEYVIQKKVIFTGKIPQNSAPEYLAACDAFLCPTQPNADGTRFFGSPTKLFEYMSMAKPVLASNLEQLSEVVSPGLKMVNGVFPTVTQEVGILIDPLIWDEWVSALIACIDMSEGDRELLGSNARAKVLKQYTWQKHVERILAFAQRG